MRQNTELFVDEGGKKRKKKEGGKRKIEKKKGGFIQKPGDNRLSGWPEIVRGHRLQGKNDNRVGISSEFFMGETTLGGKKAFREVHISGGRVGFAPTPLEERRGNTKGSLGVIKKQRKVQYGKSCLKKLERPSGGEIMVCSKSHK